MRRVAAILLCIAMCLGTVPWVAHAEGTVRYAAVTATEPSWSDGGLVNLGGPGGGEGDPGPGGDPGALTEYYDAGSNHYVVSTNCTVSPENSVDLCGCSITVNAGVTLTVEAGARIDLRGVVFTNYGTIVIHAADPAAGSPEHGLIEIRDDRYHDEVSGQDIVTDGILENRGTITVDGNLEINDGAELVNAEGASIVVDNFLRLAGGSELSNSGSVTVWARASIEVVGAVFTNESTIVIEADPADDRPDHGRIEIRDDRYHDDGTGQDIVTDGILENRGTITVDGNLEINDGAELVNAEGASIIVGNFLRLAGGASMSNSGSVTGGEGGRIELFVDDGPGAVSLIISGLSLYNGPEDAVGTGDLRGSFYYDSVASKWIRSGGPGGGEGDPGPGGDPGALTEYYDAGSNHYVVSTDCTVSPENSVDLCGCSITVNAGVTLTVEAGARIDLRGVVFTNYGTIVIHAADPAAGSPEHGLIEIRDDRYHDEVSGQDIVTDGILENRGTITVDGNLEINDGAELVNAEGASIVVDNFLRLAGGSELSNSGSVTVWARASIEVVGAVFTNESTIVIEADPADDRPDHGRIEIRDDRYHDDGTGQDIVTDGILENRGTITVDGNLEINDGAELVNAEGASIVVDNFLRLAGGASMSNSGSVTVGAEASTEVVGAVFTNEGTIVVETDQADDRPEHGRIEIRDDRYHDQENNRDIVTDGILENRGTITVDGNLEINDGAELINKEGASIIVGNFLRLAGGASMSNSGSVTGGEGGRIELFVDDDPDAASLTISGLSFYEDTAAADPITDNLRGSFYYDSAALKWARSGEPGGGEGDPGGGGPRRWRIYMDFGIHGNVEGLRDVDDGGNATFILRPDPGFLVRVDSVTVTRQTTGTPWESVDPLTDEGDGTHSIVVRNVTEDLIFSVTFVSENPPTVDSILQKSYAILVEHAGSTENVRAALCAEIEGLGYVDGYTVTIAAIDLPGDGEDYGIFTFTVTAGDVTSEETTGYIVREPGNILFKVVGEHEGLAVNEVLMANSYDAQLGVFELPAMDSGTIEIFGAYSAGMEGWLSPDVADDALTGDRYRIMATQPFYRLQTHIANRPANPADEVNWFAFDVIQADAYCVWVDASDGAGQQRTLQWDLNRYAQLTTGDYTSQVFFGNDRFTLSLPPNGLGGVTEFSVPTGTFPGYTVSHNPTDDTYTVEFLSDFYDRIALETTINGSETRSLHIHRVGVEIEVYDLYGDNQAGNVFHGTQYGSKVHYDDGTAYHIFATYCIPDGEDVPYGLYVTFTWADGSVTTEIIGAPHDPHKDPVDTVVDLFNWDRGVFVYPVHADPVDYLIYEAPTSEGAPVKVNVLVLKDDPNETGIFGGVFFGSGAGVEWQADYEGR